MCDFVELRFLDGTSFRILEALGAIQCLHGYVADHLGVHLSSLNLLHNWQILNAPQTADSFIGESLDVILRAPPLSFNIALSSYNCQAGLERFLPLEDQSVVEELLQPAPLRHQWLLWEGYAYEGKARFDDLQRSIASLCTVQDFWSAWTCIPQPSELFDGNTIVRNDGNGVKKAVTNIMVFREGICPTWEDVANRRGGHFQCTLRNNVQPWLADEYWNNLVLGTVGGTIEHSDLITGVRLLDKFASEIDKLKCVRLEL